MHVIEITDNNIIFNNGKVCQFDNTNYVLSKFLLIGNSLYRKKLLNNKKKIVKESKIYKDYNFLHSKNEKLHFALMEGLLKDIKRG